MHMINWIVELQKDPQTKKSFFSKAKQDYLQMTQNLKLFETEFIQALNDKSKMKAFTEKFFPRNRKFTIVHDAEHGDCAAVLALRLFQKLSGHPDNFLINQQVSESFSRFSTPYAGRWSLFDHLVTDNSHQVFNIIPGIRPGDFGNSVHTYGNLAWMNIASAHTADFTASYPIVLKRAFSCIEHYEEPNSALVSQLQWFNGLYFHFDRFLNAFETTQKVNVAKDEKKRLLDQQATVKFKLLEPLASPASPALPASLSAPAHGVSASGNRNAAPLADAADAAAAPGSISVDVLA